MSSSPHTSPTRHARQFWRAFFVALALASLTLTASAAEQRLTGTFTGRLVGRDVSFERKGRPITNWAGTLNLRLDNGPNVPTFCIEIDVRVQSGDRYVADGPIQQLRNGCQIRYLLQKYPASSVKSPAEAAALQLAIWHFSDDVDLNTIVEADRALRERALALVEEARQGGCPPTRAQVPALTIEPATAQARVGEAVQYTVRVSPPGAASRVTVTLSGPATFEDGQQRAELPFDGQGVVSFRVLGMALGASSVQVELPYQLDAGTVFSHIDQDRKTQRLVMADQVNLTARARAEVSWTEQGETPTPKPRPRPRPTPQPTPGLPGELPTPEQPEQPTQPEHPRTVRDAFPLFWPTPQAGEQPGAQPGEQPGAQPGAPGQGAAPGSGPGSQGGASQGAGGVSRPQPRRLPGTGAPALAWGGAGLAFASLLIVAGWLLRRRRSDSR